jgi:hypothetical protein
MEKNVANCFFVCITDEGWNLLIWDLRNYFFGWNSIPLLFPLFQGDER